jgi:tetratricopeptide (TPR) repeat protein
LPAKIRRKAEVHRLERTGGVILMAALLACIYAACGPDLGDVLQQAETSWRKGRYAEAIQANEELYKREPTGEYAARALLSIANIQYLNIRNVKQAINYYSKLTREFPDSAETFEAHRYLADIYENEMIDLDQAIRELTALLEAKDLKDGPEIRFRRAGLFFQKEDYDRALRELRGLEDSGVQGRLADQVTLKIGTIYQIQKKYDLAMEPFNAASASQFPEVRRRALMSLAESYESVLDLDKAIATIRKIPRTLEDEPFIESEIARLIKKRKGIDKDGSLIGITSSGPASPASAKKK